MLPFPHPPCPRPPTHQPRRYVRHAALPDHHRILLRHVQPAQPLQSRLAVLRLPARPAARSSRLAPPLPFTHGVAHRPRPRVNAATKACAAGQGSIVQVVLLLLLFAAVYAAGRECVFGWPAATHPAVISGGARASWHAGPVARRRPQPGTSSPHAAAVWDLGVVRLPVLLLVLMLLLLLLLVLLVVRCLGCRRRRGAQPTHPGRKLCQPVAGQVPVECHTHTPAGAHVSEEVKSLSTGFRSWGREV